MKLVKVFTFLKNNQEPLQTFIVLDGTPRAICEELGLDRVFEKPGAIAAEFNRVNKMEADMAFEAASKGYSSQFVKCKTYVKKDFASLIPGPVTARGGVVFQGFSKPRKPVDSLKIWW